MRSACALQGVGAWGAIAQLTDKEGCAKASRFILAAANPPNQVADR